MQQVKQHNFQRQAGRPRETRTAAGQWPTAPRVAEKKLHVVDRVS